MIITLSFELKSWLSIGLTNTGPLRFLLQSIRNDIPLAGACETRVVVSFCLLGSAVEFSSMNPVGLGKVSEECMVLCSCVVDGEATVEVEAVLVLVLELLGWFDRLVWAATSTRTGVDGWLSHACSLDLRRCVRVFEDVATPWTEVEAAS